MPIFIARALYPCMASLKLNHFYVIIIKHFLFHCDLLRQIKFFEVQKTNSRFQEIIIFSGIGELTISSWHIYRDYGIHGIEKMKNSKIKMKARHSTSRYIEDLDHRQGF